MIICREKLRKKIFPKVFPGLQGGPHGHTIAAIGVALKETMNPEFRKYAGQIVKNAKTLAEALEKYDFKLISGGTDNHLLLIDLTNKNIGG
ncbi:MAG: serine hydroxymethyltransferase, partial [Atribacteria sp.]|nr:serine hydroxymethyltransferase [Candidatus Atribacteria bacterium]